MAIKPILFNKQISTEMVRAILDGSKTCIRQIIKGYIPQNAQFGYSAFTPDGTISCRGLFETAGRPGYGEKFFKLPYQPGDIMYVRETWQYLYELDGNEQIIEGTGKYYYAATDTIPFDTYVDASGVTHERVPWHPSIHMPKEAARIWLKVTDVRAERLQDITPKGAESEGVGNLFYDDIGYGEKNYGTEVDPEYGIAKEQFAWLWESTIKKSDLDRYGWDANPYVWVIEFERCEKPEGV